MRMSLGFVARVAGLCGFLLTVGAGAHAADLLRVYEAAVAHDPVLAEARAQLAEDRAGVPAAWAALYPHVGAAASVGENRAHVTGIGLPELTDYLSDSYSVTLTQPLFNGQALSGLGIARAQVRAGEAGLVQARQHLILAVTDAYFGVLKAQADVRVAKKQERLLGDIYRQARAFLRVGKGDIIAVEEAQANLQAARSEEIVARNAVRVARQNLWRLTHRRFSHLENLGPVQAQLPHPDAVGPWLAAAFTNQPLLRQARANLRAARANVHFQERAMWPTLSIVGEAQHGLGLLLPRVEVNQVGASLDLSVPIYQGGGVSANTQRAQAAVAVSQNRLRDIRDAIRTETTTAFLNLQSSVSELDAARAAKDAARISLHATRKGYEVGVRSIIDVLSTATQFAAAERSYNLALYDQIVARVALKSAAGVLEPEDIAAINALLIRRARTRVWHRGAAAARRGYPSGE
ncbi:TolC family outer membrane protein [Acidiferrobacter sp.]|uniref:TolC family outer membrane protein n=1 Tax=Acidiferrobacter sp. TaxID=1872107 RepID=UPI0026274316|nr:TolC family outer membrane protein [Acidiferrobacter sp.]